ncbi:hypothetical protein LguiB_020427 [Lonicera macranthoides]
MLQLSLSPRIDAMVGEIDNRLWRVTGFYGHPESNLRRGSWNLLRPLSKRSNNPWICCGDFNELCSQAEKYGGAPRLVGQMQVFRQAINDCGFSEIQAVNGFFTWAGYRKSVGLVKEKLDRVLAPQQWLQLFPEAKVELLDHHVSDHCPLRVSFKSSFCSVGQQKKRLMFEAFWAKEQEAESIVMNQWNLGNDDIDICDRLSSCLRNLDRWSRGKFGADSKKLEVAKNKLKAITERSIWPGQIMRFNWKT